MKFEDKIKFLSMNDFIEKYLKLFFSLYYNLVEYINIYYFFINK